MTTEPVTTAEVEAYTLDPAFKEMVEAGLFIGRKKSRTNPKMKGFILTNRNGIEIINLAKTTEMAEKAATFLSEQVRKGAKVLFVATQPAAIDVVTAAQELGYPVVARRWLGGTLTNYRVIAKRLEYFKKMKIDWDNKAFDSKYTKKERLAIEKELERLTDTMAGLEAMTERPNLLVVIDPNLHLTAVREARVLKIPVVAFANTDSDPALLDCAVLGNNKARTSIKWFLDKMVAAIKDGRARAAADAPRPAEPADAPAADQKK